MANRNRAMNPILQLHQSQRLQAASGSSQGPAPQSGERTQARVAEISGPSGKCTGSSSGWEGPEIALEPPVASGAEARRPDWYELEVIVVGSKWDLKDTG